MATNYSAVGLTPAQKKTKRAALVYQYGPKSKQVQLWDQGFGGAPGRPGFTPFTPLTADKLPPGSYDVGLDAQLGAAQRGLGYLTEDTSLAGTRASDDLQLGLAKILQQRGYATENRSRSTENLARQFGILGRNQYQAARVSGTARGGALAQAFAKRSANQEYEQRDIETTYKRAGEALDTEQGALSLAFARGGEDRATALRRAGVETGFFGGDIAAAKIQQAKQTGFQFPTAPANEHLGRITGSPYQTIKRKKLPALFKLPSGQIVTRRPT